MVEIHHHGAAEAPVSVAFAYIDDYRTTSSWMFGINRFVPVDPTHSQGLGAVYDGAFAVKAVTLSSRVEVTDWEQDALIELTSIKGFTNSSTWRFTADGPTRTKISVRFTYELPGGIAGRVLGKAFEPIVALTVRQSDANLRKNIEAEYAEQQR